MPNTSTPRRRRAHLAARVWRRSAVAALGASGCRSVVDPPLPTGAERVAPPAVYARWWAMVEACSGERRSMGEVTWYVVPNVASFPPPGGGGDANGYYSRPGSQLVLAGGARYDGAVVRHEMLHALLRTEGGHPRGQFVERCAGVVRCEFACLQDAGPTPAAPAGARAVLPAALVVRSSLAPAAPSASSEDGWFTFVVTATNPAATPVIVAPSGSWLRVGFSYEVGTAEPKSPEPGEITTLVRDVLVPDETTARFAPGETKQFVFDFRVVAPGSREPGFRPGAVTFRGAFGGRGEGAWAPPLTVTLAP